MTTPTTPVNTKSKSPFFGGLLDALKEDSVQVENFVSKEYKKVEESKFVTTIESELSQTKTAISNEVSKLERALKNKLQAIENTNAKILNYQNDVAYLEKEAKEIATLVEKLLGVIKTTNPPTPVTTVTPTTVTTVTVPAVVSPSLPTVSTDTTVPVTTKAS